jgi:FkbM family methyltransferase
MAPNTVSQPAEPESRRPIRVFGHWMVVQDFERDPWISPVLAAGRLFEPFETEWIENLVRPGDNVLDIGGHIGFYTLQMARIVGPAGRVVTFEPDPVNFAYLRHNVALNGYGNVELHRAAVSRQMGHGTLYRSHDSGDHRIWKPDEPRESVGVPTVAIDHRNDLAQMNVSLIKMDIQGAEVQALEGMTEFLRRQARVALVSEFWPMAMRAAGDSAETFLRILTSLKFRLYLIDETSQKLHAVSPDQLLAIFDPNRPGFGNVLCIKS